MIYPFRIVLGPILLVCWAMTATGQSIEPQAVNDPANTVVVEPEKNAAQANGGQWLVADGDCQCQVESTCECAGGCQRCRLLKPHRHRLLCPRCEAPGCYLEVKEEKEKRSCFKIECKTICIPRVQLPWKKNCPPQCGVARKIKVLKKESYECPVCKYNWHPCCPDPASDGGKTASDSAPGDPSADPSILENEPERPNNGLIEPQADPANKTEGDKTSGTEAIEIGRAVLGSGRPAIFRQSRRRDSDWKPKSTASTYSIGDGIKK